MKFLGKLILNAVVVGMMLPMPVLLASEQESKRGAAKKVIIEETDPAIPLKEETAEGRAKAAISAREQQALVPMSTPETASLSSAAGKSKIVDDIYQDGLTNYASVCVFEATQYKIEELTRIRSKLLSCQSDSRIGELVDEINNAISDARKEINRREEEEKEKEARLTESQRIVAEYGQQKESKCSAAAAQPKADKEIKSEKSGLLAAPEISISRPHSWRRNIVFASIFAVAAAIGAWFWFSRSKIS